MSDWSWLLPIAVVMLPAIITLIGQTITRETRVPASVHNIERLSNALEKASSEGNESRRAIDELLLNYVESVSDSLTQRRKLSVGGVIGYVVLLILTVVVMSFLWYWITVANDGVWLAWLVTAVVALVLIPFHVVAISSIYESRSQPARGRVDVRSSSSGEVSVEHADAEDR